MQRNFTIIIPVLNQHEQATQYLTSWFNLAKGLLNVVFIDNGSDPPWDWWPAMQAWRDDGHIVKCVTNPENVGVYPTFQQGYDVASTAWLFYSHSDVEMLEPGWDEKLQLLLNTTNEDGHAGVCGMFGAKGIGTNDIYQAPYDYKQMVRWDCYTVPSMAGAGGQPIQNMFERVVVLDGFSLIINRDMIDHVGGFDHIRFPVHHCYDTDICLMSHYAGYRNYVLDIDCIHHGGMTSTRENWAEDMGSTDLKIHRQAHKVLYDKYDGRLPVSVQ